MGDVIGSFTLISSRKLSINSLETLGPVLMGGGLITLTFSVEVCFRLYKAKKRVQDPELDNLINPHEIKHWMDPKLIPFGWGLFKEDEDEILVLDKGTFGFPLEFSSEPSKRLNKSLGKLLLQNTKTWRNYLSSVWTATNGCLCKISYI